MGLQNSFEKRPKNFTGCNEAEIKKILGVKSLARADLTDADLIGTNLRGADLMGTNLTDVDLTDADLTRSDLTGAALYHAILRRTILTEANLAELTPASIYLKLLEDVDLSRAVNVPAGFLGWAKENGAAGLEDLRPVDGDTQRTAPER